MGTIAIKSFDGLAPKISPRLLGDSKAQVASNVLLEDGKLRPLNTISGSVKALGTTPATIYRFGNTASDTASWLSFTTRSSVITSPVFNDTWNRVYWSTDDGSAPPKYAPASGLFSGGIGPSGTTYTLGIPAPAAAPTVNGSSAALVTSADWDYIVTYTSAAGDSAPSEVVTVKGPATRGSDWTTYPVTLSSIPVPDVPALYTGKKLWAKLSSGSTYNLVSSSLGITATSFTDNLTSLGAAYATTSGILIDPPAKPIAAVTSPLSLITADSVSYYYTYYSPAELVVDSSGYNTVERWDPERAGTLSAVGSVSVNVGQPVTLTIPASATSGKPLVQVPKNFGIFRKRPGDPEPLLIGYVAIPASGAVTFVDTDNSGTIRYSSMYRMSELSPYSWVAPPNFTSVVGGTSSGFTAANVVTYQYCATYLRSGADESLKSEDSEYVRVAEANSVRQQTVRISFDPAPVGMTTKLYRRTVTVAAGSGGTASSTTVTNDYKLLTTLAAGVGQFEDGRLNDLATASIPSASALAIAAGPEGVFGASSSVPGAPTLETRGYCYTYVTAYGEEGPPSPVPTLVDINPAATVNLSGMSVSPGASWNVTKKYIYRSNSGTDKASFQFVAEVPVATTTYADTKAAAALGELLPSESWYAPPTNMVGLCLGGNGIAAGFIPGATDATSTLCFSEPYMPHAWPPEYQVSAGVKVLTMVPFAGNAWAVLTTNYPHVAIGTDPSAVSIEKLSQPQSCASVESAVATDAGVVYASPDGLCLLTPSGVSLMTDNLYTRAQWQALGPSSMRSLVHNNRVLVFHSTGVLIFDFSNKSAILTTAAITTGAGFYDAISDTLFLTNGTNIVKWAGGIAMTGTWRSRLYSLPQPTSFPWAQVEADDYPVTVKFYTDGSQMLVSPGGAPYTVVVASRDPFRLPSWTMYRDIEIELSGTKVVHSVALAHSSQELAGL